MQRSLVFIHKKNVLDISMATQKECSNDDLDFHTENNGSITNEVSEGSDTSLESDQKTVIVM